MPNRKIPHILAIIPARQGSKSIPHKNIRSVGGKPLMAYSIEHALLAKRITRTIVSTDSAYYADIARSYGAEVPFLRPEAISQDHSTDLEVFQHALQWLQESENYVPDICVHLRPTSPVRKAADIDSMIEILMENPSLDAVRSVAANLETPYKMWFRDEEGLLKPIVQRDLQGKLIEEAYNMPRQKLPVTYLQNASVDVVRTSTLLEKNSMTGDAIYGYVMAENFDIDYESQLTRVATQLVTNGHGENKSKIFCFDIDGVIACLTPDNDYAKADCHTSTIDIINTLYEQGHYIILFTARGTKTGIDWKNTTEEQLHRWGVKYHELKFGKPAADFYIDDRMITINDLEKIVKL
ncbi:acylneuraminate cytidylyltransferase family protein [Rhodocytophaga aerolata]|uniref:N-acylneuraminate cytidylyltransferase n=1 Tax=Rhodocytophaga aerolata TaxID=455078 RepID=A0ABT8RH20_9BACT|nr:acylneuraminate cytidylyltransferase family protein [Rhodocytophaga aerolata]MDO1451001.1 acylneuraminate cytidylyltransferase family protein [Rhodocytophaga aerolata]